MKAAVNAGWSDLYRNVVTSSGIHAEYFDTGDALADSLAGDWSVDLIVVDLGLASPALARRLGPDGPRLLVFGDAAQAGVALAGNLAGFLTEAPSPAELIAAIEAALAPGPAAGVADLSDKAIARLGALGAEARRISAALARLEAEAMQAPLPALDPDRVRAAIHARRTRDRFFPADIFGEPAWDMLLDLASAWLEHRDVAVSSLCIAAAVPTTTALRWIKNLCDAGLFERRNDPHDARRAFISLSASAATAMARYFAQV